MHTRSLITRRKALLAGAGAIAAPFVVTTPGFGQTGPIKLAGLVSLTGSGSPYGPNSRLAHQAVVDQVNAAGGLLGRKLEYLSEDDQTNAEAGIRAARKLIACTLSTSISLRAARWPASALVWSSSERYSSLRPSSPPAALT